VQYNNALITFEYAKGNILRFHTIAIAEGQLPSFAEKRAVVHEQERAAAIVRLLRGGCDGFAQHSAQKHQQAATRS
jgi:hypothetical protein